MKVSKQVRRFVVADPSMSTLGGHYLEYLKRVIGAAELNGFAGIVACNINLDAKAGEAIKWPVLPVFRYDIWGEDPSQRESQITPSTAASRRMARLSHSRLAMLWELAKNSRTTRHYSQAAGLAPSYGRRFAKACEVFDQVQAGLATAGSDWSKATGERQLQMEYEAIREVLSGKLVGVRSSSISDALKEAREAVIQSNKSSSSFAESLNQVLDQQNIGGNDIVFLPTMSWGDARGLETLIRRRRWTSELPQFALVFRRDIYRQYPDTWDNQEYATHEYKNLLVSLERLNQELGKDQCVVFTDTKELSSQYSRIFSRVETLPVPCEELPAASRQENSKDPITIGYLGDARPEKGFQYLNEMLAKLDDAELETPVRLLSQAYVPKRSADVNMLKSIELLRLRTPHKVELAEGSLSSNEYRDLIERMDVILVPYDRENYAARSSGVFMEALCARRPPIVTAGTWMARILDEYTFEYHQNCIRPVEVLGRTTAGMFKWQRFSDGIEHEVSVGTNGSVSLPALGQGTHTAISVASEATHVWISFDRSKKGANLFTRLFVAARDDEHKEISVSHFVVGGDHSNRCSIVIPIPAGTDTLWCSFSNAYSSSSFELEGLEVALLATDRPISRCFGGLTLDDGFGSNFPKALASAVIEANQVLVELARTAIELGDRVGPKNTSDALVKDLLAGMN